MYPGVSPLHLVWGSLGTFVFDTITNNEYIVTYESPITSSGHTHLWFVRTLDWLQYINGCLFFDINTNVVNDLTIVL